MVHAIRLGNLEPSIKAMRSEPWIIAGIRRGHAWQSSREPWQAMRDGLSLIRDATLPDGARFDQFFEATV